ncbi:EamA/RhaT family transporter [Psychromonas sp. B3M02]|uniref:DMT family transporter n=1 Tax=Psychromonas sp. B3M02 TaxID=2267226 RepID=UPI000DEBDC87|nr:DMT family transporter [Psychromonas sp. B3M02]RBW46082.1 EamA/RhaT family transporter [Psychromonas sp. B3M02]
MTLNYIPTIKDWLFLLLLILLWGTSFMFTAVSLQSFSPVAIVSLRVLIAAIILTLFMYIKGWRLPVEPLAWGIFLLFGIMGNLLPFFLISTGQKDISSGITGLLMAFMPLVTMILAHYFVSGESLNRFKVFGFLLGITGVVIVLWPSLVGAHSSLLSGLLILFATFSYAINAILVRRLPSYNPVVTAAGVMIISSLVIVPLWLWQDLPWQQSYSLTASLSMLWLGVGPTAFATILLFAVIGSAGPTFLSYINYVIPIVAYFTGALLLGEAIEWRTLAAMIFIIIGIALTRKRVAIE